MFKLAVDPKFTVPVTAMVPVDGGHEKQEFKATFRVVPIDELGDTGDLEGQQRMLCSVFVGFQDVQDETGQPVPYSDTVRDQLAALPFVRAALIQTYLAAVTRAPAGN